MQVSEKAKIALGFVAGVLVGIFIGPTVVRAETAAKHTGGILSDVPFTPTKSWGGIYVGGNIGYGIETTGQGFDLDDVTFGGEVGVDFHMAKHWVVGAFGGYDFAKGGSIDDGWWTAGVRAGYLVTPSVLLYGMGGLVATELSGLTDEATMLGLGVEAKANGPWSLKLEYRNIDADHGHNLHHVRLGVAYKFDLGK